MRSLKSFSSRSSTGGWGFDVEECEEQNSAQSCGRAGWPSANRAASQPAQLRAPNNLSSPPAYNWQHIFGQIFSPRTDLFVAGDDYLNMPSRRLMPYSR